MIEGINDAERHEIQKEELNMTKTFNSYTEAVEFAAMQSDRYEVKVVKTTCGYMVICER